MRIIFGVILNLMILSELNKNGFSYGQLLTITAGLTYLLIISDNLNEIRKTLNK